MSQKTKDYSIFKFRTDNRAQIDDSHVKKLIESIKSDNLLQYRPILVNEQMEIIDGQHRLLAAQKLNCEVHYQVVNSFKPEDIPRLNTSKKWQALDYLNFFIKNGNEDYNKFKEFMVKNNLHVSVALSLMTGRAHDKYDRFRQGTFKFNKDCFVDDFDKCWETIDYIKKMNGVGTHLRSSKFWKALLILFRHPSFDYTKWKGNLERFVSKITPKARKEDYLELFEDIYNWHNQKKISLEGSEIES